MYSIFLYSISVIAVLISHRASREKTRQAVTSALKSFFQVAPAMVGIIGIVGLILAMIPPQWISEYLGKGAGIAGTIGAAMFGAVTLIPGLIAFPLAGSLYQEGASTMTIAAFITTLTMVGVVTAPVEIQQLGKKMTLWRNGLSFVSALIISAIMGVVLG
jgi:uncharacterized membrane protein YraQ (UPF0718 family)